MTIDPRQAESRGQAEPSEPAQHPSLGHSGPSEPAHLTICVVWASPGHIESVSLVLPVGTQVQHALEQSGLLQKYQPTGLAIFGQRCDPTRVLSDGDRIELCRPLVVEPKAARRRRALHREKVRNIKKKMPIDDLTV